ncbi:type VII secretion system-associated protein [Streptomyces otsuchiensis]|uniref:type VII secretion system-associated protein n=1 Tax=Streptomyces otsuchiensis TaxID=2681388 RepID=UPI001D131353|nr:type VII secretion system-associated protein [Streptomyces otsuchiensis]
MSTEDPNSDTGPLKMDKAGLQAFLSDRVEPFEKRIREMNTDETDAPSMTTLSRKGDIDVTDTADHGRTAPLSLGAMLLPGSFESKGQQLNSAMGESASSLHTIFGDQEKLFKDVTDNLITTIDTLMTTQGGNLTEIDGQDFLDVFEGIDSRLGGGSNSGSDNS